MGLAFQRGPIGSAPKYLTVPSLYKRKLEWAVEVEVSLYKIFFKKFNAYSNLMLFSYGRRGEPNLVSALDKVVVML